MKSKSPPIRANPSMALREVLKFPDKRLRVVSKPITEVTDEIRELASDMLEVMYDEPGIGLAAPQVGEPVRLIVVDTEWTQEGGEKNPLILVNPEVHEPQGKIVWTEGCLSVPDFEAEVERAEKVILAARGTWTETTSGSKPKASRPSASSTRSITWTASSSSTASAGSSATCTCRSARSSSAGSSKRPAPPRRPDPTRGPSWPGPCASPSSGHPRFRFPPSNA